MICRGEHRKLHPIPKPHPRLIPGLADTGTQQPTYILSRSSVHIILLLIGLLCSEGKPGSKAKVSFRSFLKFLLIRRFFAISLRHFGYNLSLCFLTALSVAKVATNIIITSTVNVIHNKLLIVGAKMHPT